MKKICLIKPSNEHFNQLKELKAYFAHDCVNNPRTADNTNCEMI